MTAGLAQILTPEGWALLASLPPYDPDSVMALSEQLRREGASPELVAAALTQSRLRAKARAKFGDFAASMIFTDHGLQQATRLTVAALHAARYRDAGLHRVADMTCGIGADAMAMAALGLRPLAIERDEQTAAAALVNLRFFPQAEVRCDDCLSIDLDASGVEALYADPARRTSAGRRVFDPGAYQPPLGALLALRERYPLGIKVAPGIAHGDIPAAMEAQWVSVDGDVVECGLWSGPLRDPGLLAGAEQAGAPLRSAKVIRGQGAVTVRPQGADQPGTGALGDYLYEPDGAVIRAHLVSEVAAATGGWLVHPEIAYVTSGQLTDLAYAQAYRVLDSMPFALKPLKAYLRERSVGRATIKKRGTAVDPAQLRRQLALRGDNEATIILTRIGAQHSAIIAEPATPR